MTERQNTGNKVPSNKMADLNDNTISFDEFINSSSDYTTDRFGVKYKTRKKILSDLQNAVDGAQKNSFLPLSGGNVTGDITINKVKVLKEGDGLSIAKGGTVTGATNFSGGLKINGIDAIKVGDYGLGKFVINLNNTGSLNDLTMPTQFSWFNTTTGGTKPCDYGFMINQQINNDHAFQIASNHNKDSVYFRRIASKKPSEWFEFITTANISSYQTGLGINQTWQDVASERSLNVVYTNLSEKPIFIYVCVTNYGKGISASYITATIDGLDIQSSAGGLDVSGALKAASIYIPIPAGSTYKLTSINSVLYKWSELR